MMTPTIQCPPALIQKALLYVSSFFIVSSQVFLQDTGFTRPFFEISVPEAGILSTSVVENDIPSPNIEEIIITVLNPYAEKIGYSQIFVFVNGEAASPISEMTVNERGKTVRLFLRSLPGFSLKFGKNTIEIKAETKTGRILYGNFILRTTMAEVHPDILQEVEIQGKSTPPVIFLDAPTGPVYLSSKEKNKTVRVSGLVSSLSGINSVTINSVPIALRLSEYEQTRRFDREGANKKMLIFNEIINISEKTTKIIILATDQSGSRLRVEVPVRRVSNFSPAFQGRKFALIVGISNFRHSADGIANLRFADNDAISIKDFLESPNGGKFDPSHIRLLTNEQATRQNFLKALNDLLRLANPEDLLLIFFASHGGPDPQNPSQLYFVFHDTKVDDIARTGFPMRQLQMEITQRARVKRLIMLIDTCHSAGLTLFPNEGIRSFGANTLNLYVEKLFSEEGRAVLTSSDVNEVSREGQQWGGGHGVFTHFLLQGLKGHADTNKDHIITLGELFPYVRQQVRLETRFLQNPRLLIGTNQELAIATY